MFAEVEKAFAVAMKERHGWDLTVKLMMHGYHPLILYSVECQDQEPSYLKGELSVRNFDRSSPTAFWDKTAFCRLSQDKQIELLIRDYPEKIRLNKEIFDAIRATEDSVSEQDREVMKDLEVRKIGEDTEHFNISITWTGRGSNLLVARQASHFRVNAREVSDLTGFLARKIHAAATMTRTNEKAAARGYTIERPLQAFLLDAGWTQEQFTREVLKNINDDSTAAKIQIGNWKIRIKIVHGEIKAQIALNDNVTWSKGCLTARGLTVPESLASSMVGESLRKFVDHPWLDGLVVASVSQSKNYRGETCVAFTTRAAA